LTATIYIIMPERHGPDPLCGGFVFISTTISAIGVLGLHNRGAVEAPAALYIPAGRTVKLIYAMDVAGRFGYLERDHVLTMIIDAYQGPRLLDFQLELAPLVPGLTAAPTQPVKVSTLEHKSTANAIVVAKDGKSAKGTTVAKAGKGTAAAKGAKGGSTAKSATPAPAKEVIPTKEVAN